MMIVLFWFFVFFSILLYCIISEIRSQGCIVSCENQAPTPEIGDTKEELNQKIANGTRLIYQAVDWRKSMFVAILAVLFVVGISYLGRSSRWVYTKSGFPRGIDLAIALLTVFIVVYFGFLYLQEHFWKPISIQIRETAEDI